MAKKIKMDSVDAVLAIAEKIENLEKENEYLRMVMEQNSRTINRMTAENTQGAIVHRAVLTSLDELKIENALLSEKLKASTTGGIVLFFASFALAAAWIASALFA